MMSNDTMGQISSLNCLKSNGNETANINRKHKDKRYRSTEFAIRCALNEALRRRRIDLRVKAICGAARITTQTFYLHYVSSDQALRAHEAQMRAEVLGNLRGRTQKDVMFMLVLRFVREHRDYFSAVMNSQNYWLLTEILKSARGQFGKGICSARNYQYYAQSLIALIELWVVYDDCAIERLEFYMRKMLNVRVIDVEPE